MVMNLFTAKHKCSRNGTTMKNRKALSIALSALLVFNAVPSSALRAIAEEVTPQVELTEGPEDTLPDGTAGDATQGEGFEPGDGDDTKKTVPSDGQGSSSADITDGDGEEEDGESADGEDADDDSADDENSDEEAVEDESDPDKEEDEDEKSQQGATALRAPTGLLAAPRASSEPTLVKWGINNPANTTIDLFDYWITSQEAQDHGLSNNEAAGYYGWGNNATLVNKGINKDHTLLFHGGCQGAHPTAYAAEMFTGMSSGSAPSRYWGPVSQGIVQNTLVNGYPVLNDNKHYTQSDPFISMNNGNAQYNTNNDRFWVRDSYTQNESLEYLFNPATGERVRNASGQMVAPSTIVDGKASYPDINGLFSVDSEGYYVYNSGLQAAAYDLDTNRIILDNQPTGQVGFWPLDGSNSGVQHLGNDHNGYSGMHMNMSFSMPANGNVLNPQGEYVPMSFTFAGDDDVWVFIDGVLVGDVGGIHQPSSLQIDFKTGDVKINQNFHGVYNVEEERGIGNPEYVAPTNLKTLYEQAGRADTTTWKDNTFADGTYHTIDFYYLERGNNESNLVVRFNMINTTDFTAHKALVAEPEEPLGHDRFQFELVGLDGLYHIDGTTGKSELVEGHENDSAIKPYGAETHTDPNAEAEAGDVRRYYHDDGDRWVYRVGAAADGNVNFGNAYYGHEGDGAEIGDTYRYIIQEVSSVVEDVEMDSRVYYMEATVSEDPVTHEKYLSKRYYTDDTFTTLASDVNFASFVNLKGEVPKATPRLTVNKDLRQNGALADITEGQFAFEAVDSHGKVVATSGASDATTHVAQATLTLPTLTAVDFDGVLGTTKSFEYTIREIIPDGATDNEDGTFTLNGVKYKYDATQYKATFSATYANDGSSITTTDPVYTKADGSAIEGSVPFFHNFVPASINVVKAWKNAEGGTDTVSHDLDSVWVQLYKQTRENENAEWSPDTLVGEAVELNKDHDGNWTHSFELAESDTGQNVRYIVKEGTKNGDAFVPLAEYGAIMAAKSATDSTGKPYTLDSVEWTGGSPYSDGYVSVSEWGTATETIANKPLQANIKLLKVDADSAGGNATMSGVKFKLVEDADFTAGTTPAYDAASDVTVVPGGNELTTGADGTVNLPKLDPGAYWLIETDVPDGYLLRDANHPIGITVVINEGAMVLSLVDDSYDTTKTKPTLSEPDEDNVYTLTARNVRTYSLPSAGGPGVYPFLLVGAFAAAFAASETLDKRKNPTRSLGRHGRLGDL